MYSPTQSGASPSMMYGLGADYSLSDSLSVRAAVDTTTYSVNNIQYAFTPVTVDIIYHQTVAGVLTPYAGAGLGYYSSTAGGSTASTMGYQAEAGVTFALGGFNAGVEFRYMVPDTAQSASSSSWNGYATGALSQSFNI